MALIEIEKLTDSHDCETCGCSFADGARVRVDGEIVLDLDPVAHCFDGTSYDDDEICSEILRHFASGRLVYSSEEGSYRRALLAMGHTIRIV